MARFVKGQSGNPAGKPRGTRSKATVLAEQLLEDGVQNVVRAVVDAANDGDMTAAKLVLERLLPIRRGRPVVVDIPAGTDAASILNGLSNVTRLVGAGEITPEEGGAIASLLEVRRKTLETASLADRLDILEKKVGMV